MLDSAITDKDQEDWMAQDNQATQTGLMDSDVGMHDEEESETTPTLDKRSDERASDYVGSSDRKDGKEKKNSPGMRFRKNPHRNEDTSQRSMTTMKKSMASIQDSLPTSYGTFEFSSGWVELGYDNDESKSGNGEDSEEKSSDETTDEKDDKENDNGKEKEEESEDEESTEEKAKKNIFISYQSREKDPLQKRGAGGDLAGNLSHFSKGLSMSYHDNKDRYKRVNYLKASEDSNVHRMHRGWREFSARNLGDTVYDDVVFFDHANDQQNGLMQNMAMDDVDDRTSIQDWRTSGEDSKAKEKSMKLNFEARLKEQINKMVEEYKKSDDFWLILKNQTEEQELEENADEDEPDNNSTEENQTEETKKE